MTYWQMQLHPEDDTWGNEDIREILKHGLIGCSGAPIVTFNQLNVNDIILVRHKEKEAIALCRILEAPRDTLPNEHNDYVWFDRCCKVEILDWYKNKKISAEGFSYMGTIARVHDGRAFTYMEDLYKDYLSKQSSKQMQNYISILEQKNQIILQGAPGTGKTRAAEEIAYKMIFDKILPTGKTERDKVLKELYSSEQFALVQFHPAYSYEDFVRGIVAETKENMVSYEVRDKILIEMAKLANKNLIDSQKEIAELSREQNLEELFESFKEYIGEIIIINGGYKLTKSAKITRIDSNRFLYNRSGTNTYIHFNDFLTLYRNDVKTLEDAQKLDVRRKVLTPSLFGFNKILLDNFRIFVGQNTNSQPSNIVEKTKLKKYILIIDEINRANLPAVLGELIYALEYRGKPVNSLYELDGNREIILPENLYIIGTMNTADRSVGHIDYAIRRRFAFVTVPPDENAIKNQKAKDLFVKIKGVFDKNPPSDFDKDDIMIGHSYFLVGDESELEMRLEYEIKPLLREYVKDGILTCDKKIIDDLTI